MANTTESISPLMRTLSTHIAGARRRRLEAVVATRTKIHLLDTFAAIIAGSRLPPG